MDGGRVGHPAPEASAGGFELKTRLLLLALLFVVLAPAPALACPVCGLAGPGNNGWAYFAMTMMLSIVPLAFLGGLAYWIHRRIKAQADEVADPASATPASLPAPQKP